MLVVQCFGQLLSIEKTFINIFCPSQNHCPLTIFCGILTAISTTQVREISVLFCNIHVQLPVMKRIPSQALQRLDLPGQQFHPQTGRSASFVKRKKNKGGKDLINICTLDACQAIKNAASGRGDHKMIINIGNVNLVAAEAKYHSTCHANYVSKSNLKLHQFKEEGKKRCLCSCITAPCGGNLPKYISC